MVRKRSDTATPASVPDPTPPAPPPEKTETQHDKPTPPTTPDPNVTLVKPPPIGPVRTVTGNKRDLPYEGQIPRLPEGYEAIVTSVFRIQDPHETYAKIEAGLRPIKASQSSAAVLLDTLDEAQEIARLAVQLLVNAKATADAVESDSLVMRSAMREQASAALEVEKDQGMRKKAITDSDVVAAMSTMFPDEYRDLEQRASRTRRTLTYLEALCDRTAERARDLRAIVASSRSV